MASVGASHSAFSILYLTIPGTLLIAVFFFFPGVDGEDAMKSKVSRVQRGGIFLPHVGVFEVFIFCDYLTENNLALHLIIIRITQIIFLAAVGIRYFFALSRAAYFL